MTVPVDDHPLRKAEASGGSYAPADPYVHLPTRVTVRSQRPLPDFHVVAEPATGQLTVIGEFDLACGGRFRAASAAILAGDAAEAVVDLTRLAFIDARAIETLVEFGNSLAGRGATLRIINADARVVRIFAICGLAAMLTAGTPPSRDEEST